MANTVTDDAMAAVAVAGFAVGSLADRELAYLTSKVAGVGSFADKAVNQGRVPLTPLKTYP
jgi:hypothetical protein